MVKCLIPLFRIPFGFPTQCHLKIILSCSSVLLLIDARYLQCAATMAYIYEFQFVQLVILPDLIPENHS